MHNCMTLYYLHKHFKDLDIAHFLVQYKPRKILGTTMSTAVRYVLPPTTY